MSHKIFTNFNKALELDSDISILDNKELTEVLKLDDFITNLGKKKLIADSGWLTPESYIFNEGADNEAEYYYKKVEFNITDFPLHLIPFIRIVAISKSTDFVYTNIKNLNFVINEIIESDFVMGINKTINIKSEIYLQTYQEVRFILALINPQFLL